MKKIIRYFKRKRYLFKEKGFYKSQSGKFVHPHVMAIVTPKELFNMSDEDFEIISH